MSSLPLLTSIRNATDIHQLVAAFKEILSFPSSDQNNDESNNQKDNTTSDSDDDDDDPRIKHVFSEVQKFKPNVYSKKLETITCVLEKSDMILQAGQQNDAAALLTPTNDERGVETNYCYIILHFLNTMLPAGFPLYNRWSQYACRAYFVFIFQLLSVPAYGLICERSMKRRALLIFTAGAVLKSIDFEPMLHLIIHEKPASPSYVETGFAHPIFVFLEILGYFGGDDAPFRYHWAAGRIFRENYNLLLHAVSVKLFEEKTCNYNIDIRSDGNFMLDDQALIGYFFSPFRLSICQTLQLIMSCSYNSLNVIDNAELQRYSFSLSHSSSVKLTHSQMVSLFAIQHATNTSVQSEDGDFDMSVAHTIAFVLQSGKEHCIFCGSRLLGHRYLCSICFELDPRIEYCLKLTHAIDFIASLDALFVSIGSRRSGMSYSFEWLDPEQELEVDDLRSRLENDRRHQGLPKTEGIRMLLDKLSDLMPSAKFEFKDPRTGQYESAWVFANTIETASNLLGNGTPSIFAMPLQREILEFFVGQCAPFLVENAHRYVDWAVDENEVNYEVEIGSGNLPRYGSHAYDLVIIGLNEIILSVAKLDLMEDTTWSERRRKKKFCSWTDNILGAPSIAPQLLAVAVFRGELGLISLILTLNPTCLDHLYMNNNNRSDNNIGSSSSDPSTINILEKILKCFFERHHFGSYITIEDFVDDYEDVKVFSSFEMLQTLLLHSESEIIKHEIVKFMSNALCPSNNNAVEEHSNQEQEEEEEGRDNDDDDDDDETSRKRKIPDGMVLHFAYRFRLVEGNTSPKHPLLRLADLFNKLEPELPSKLLTAAEFLLDYSPEHFELLCAKYVEMAHLFIEARHSFPRRMQDEDESSSTSYEKINVVMKSINLKELVPSSSTASSSPALGCVDWIFSLLNKIIKEDTKKLKRIEEHFVEQKKDFPDFLFEYYASYASLNSCFSLAEKLICEYEFGEFAAEHAVITNTVFISQLTEQHDLVRSWSRFLMTDFVEWLRLSCAAIKRHRELPSSSGSEGEETFNKMQTLLRNLMDADIKICTTIRDKMCCGGISGSGEPDNKNNFRTMFYPDDEGEVSSGDVVGTTAGSRRRNREEEED